MSTNRKHVIQSVGSAVDRIEYHLAHMEQNRAYGSRKAQPSQREKSSLLQSTKDDFMRYRQAWNNQPAKAHREKIFGKGMVATDMAPLCVDIELSAMCDLACPFCYRQFIATPDKLMDEALCYAIIDQAADLGVPSIKFNWRGEPLLHPKLPKFISYAKDKGILDTIINTNAVTLTEAKGIELIEAGLDFLIYSFDGGSKESYEKMRPGRFADNSFDSVYKNIKTLHKSRTTLGAAFPFTKIQMVLTEDTYSEQEAFFNLFSDYVDDVSVKAYTERGGSLSDLDAETYKKVTETAHDLNLPIDSPYYRDMKGTVHISSGRLPCEQPYQRLSVSCDGAVSMCCYDWGIEHPIGYVDEAGFEGTVAGAAAVVKKTKEKVKGYSCFDQLRIPKPIDTAPKSVTTLRDIWHGEAVNAVRSAHIKGELETIAICQKCPFKETYAWTEGK